MTGKIRIISIVLLFCFLASTAAARESSTPAWEQDLKKPEGSLTPASQVTPKGTSNVPQYTHGTPSPTATPAGERALLSGIPRYYQTLMSNPAMCGGAEYLTGCGPVAGATILGWWERRGITGLMLPGVSAYGIPDDTIIELGKIEHMARLPSCDATATAVLPDNFKNGLQRYLDKYSSVKFTVTKHKIEENSDIDYFWSIVKSEIDSGRPMVYLYRNDGEGSNGEFSFADHYATIVGYEDQSGKKILIVQPNWGELGTSTTYMNKYNSPQNLYLELGHYAVETAAINYNLYTIVPEKMPDYKNKCNGWLITNYSYHEDSYDGVQSSYFSPAADYLLGTWGKTNDLTYQDGTCFVAHYYDSDEDGYYDGMDNCPDDYNPGQEDKDGDDIGDICDKPDIVLHTSYGSPTYETAATESGTLLTFHINSYIANEGTESIPAGTQLQVTWGQEVVEIGSGSSSGNQSTQTLKIMKIPAKDGKVKLLYNMKAAYYNPLEHSSQSVTLAIALNPKDKYQLNDVVFYATINSPADCVLITHTGSVKDTVEELNEDNSEATTGYNTLANCYGINEVDFETYISGIAGQQVKEIQNLKDFEAATAKNIKVQLTENIPVQIPPEQADMMAKHILRGEQLKSVSKVTVDGKAAVNLVKVKHAKLLGLIPVQVEEEVTVSEQTGNVLQSKKPAWSFLAF